ncbi:MAG: FAD-binding protein [Actinobacteria bacterium]|nr:FAD-binding protein [Actinomycetota bacterium]
MRSLVVLDGTVGTADRQARALGAFLRDGSTGHPAAETLVFFSDDRDMGRLVEQAPTRGVRLVKTAERRPDAIVDILSAAARDAENQLFIFTGGYSGTELATRLAHRTGGTVMTDALSIEIGPERLTCRRPVYSNHMVGSFELAARPWCVSIDVSWDDEAAAARREHVVLSSTDETGAAGGPDETPFEDLELVEPPPTGDLEQSRFLVVAGAGAGSRDGVERIAAAARRMGAEFAVSRPVAMSAWAPMDRLIGVSGTRTAPELCIVAGASGAPALYWGIEKAGFIAAIDLDERAPIAKSADAVILDDGVAVIEELAEIIAPKRE